MTSDNQIDKFLQNELDPGFERRARLILENLKIKKNEKLLDIGCGRGFYTKAVITIYPGARITALDTCDEYLEKAKNNVNDKRVKFVKGDACHLPFAANTFDRVICSEVLEHIPDDSQVIREIKRVLKPGGIALISVPFNDYPFLWDPANFVLEKTFGIHLPSSIWWVSGIWAGHLRLYSEKELRDKFTSGKLKIKKIWHATAYCLPFSHFLLYGVGKNLVEKGIVTGGANRFDFEAKPSFLVKFIKSIFGIFDRFNTRDTKNARFLNLILSVQK